VQRLLVRRYRAHHVKEANADITLTERPAGDILSTIQRRVNDGPMDVKHKREEDDDACNSAATPDFDPGR
jgi:hypothetical protein